MTALLVIDAFDRGDAVEAMAMAIYGRHAKTPWSRARDDVREAFRADAEMALAALLGATRTPRTLEVTP